MGNFSNYWDLTTLFTKLKNKLKSISDKIDDSVSLKTATGNPITLTDAANANAEELSMTIEPIQDLHGYTKPWPGGAVKNIAHIDATKIFSTEKDPSDPITGITDGMLILGAAVNGYVRPVHLVSYTINSPNSITAKIADAPGAHAYGVGIVVEIDTSKTYTLSMETGGWVSVGWLNSDGSNLSYTGDKTLPCTLTPPSGAKYAMIACLPGRNLEHTFSNIQLEEGTSATTFEPWENICPISGLTSGEVTALPENDYEEFFEGLREGTYGFVDLGSLTWAYDTTNKYFDCELASYGYSGTDYKIACGVYASLGPKNTSDMPNAENGLYNWGTHIKIKDTAYTDAATFKSAMSGVYLIYKLAQSTAPTYTNTQWNAIVNSFNGHTATITFGQTVYGGSVNFKTGEVTVTHGIVDLGTLTWRKEGSYNEYRASLLANMKTYADNVKANALCSAYSILTANQTYHASNKGLSIATTYISIGDNNYETAADITSALSGVQLCYELATPTTLTLTPAELDLLKGNNTITANGAEISIKYYPDNAIGALAGRVDAKPSTADVDTRVRQSIYELGEIGSYNGNYYGRIFPTETGDTDLTLFRSNATPLPGVPAWSPALAWRVKDVHAMIGVGYNSGRVFISGGNKYNGVSSPAWTSEILTDKSTGLSDVTKLAYLNNVTSDIQTQINGKAGAWILADSTSIDVSSQKMTVMEGLGILNKNEVFVEAGSSQEPERYFHFYFIPKPIYNNMGKVMYYYDPVYEYYITLTFSGNGDIILTTPDMGPNTLLVKVYYR